MKIEKSTIREHFVVGELTMLGIDNSEFEVNGALLLLEHEQLSLYLGIEDLFGTLVRLDLKVTQDLLNCHSLVRLVR